MVTNITLNKLSINLLSILEVRGNLFKLGYFMSSLWGKEIGVREVLRQNRHKFHYLNIFTFDFGNIKKTLLQNIYIVLNIMQLLKIQNLVIVL